MRVILGNCDNMLIYFLLVRIAALFNEKARKLSEGESRALDYLRKHIDKTQQYVWFHVASVGEFEQARPIMDRLRKEQPDKKILLTFFSPSGYELKRGYKGADIITYLPFATKSNAKEFLDIVNPIQAIFAKYEFWPAYLKELHKRNIPTFVFASIFRRSQLFFKWYGKSYLNLLNYFTKILVQDENSKSLLAEFGVNNVVVAGDTRFDRVIEIAGQPKFNTIIEEFKNVDDKPMLIAGSTWWPDEELLIRYFNKHPDFKLLIVPHEIDKDHIDLLRDVLGGKALFYTEATNENIVNYRCLVLNTLGMLSTAYRYGNVAYVGGGFGAGIHNTLEAAVYGIPVVFGPKYKKFREARGLIECGGAFSIKNKQELNNILDQLLADGEAEGEKAGQYVEQQRGAVEVVYKELFS